MQNKLILTTLATFSLVIAGCANLNTSTKVDTPKTAVNESKSVSASINVVDADKAKIDKVISNKLVDEKTAMSKDALVEPQYINFTEKLYQDNLGKRPMVVFFHAGWCPTCQQIEKSVTVELSNFPSGTLILKADYDKSTELKKKYGVQVQSTLVFLNANGEVTDTLLGPDNEAIKASIEKSLK